MSSVLFPAKLMLHQLRLMVHIGHGKQERDIPQIIDISVELYLSNLPKACHTDGEGFLCYHKLSDMLRSVVEHKRFALIEYMAMRMCEAMEIWLNEQAEQAGIHKVCYIFRLDKVDAPVPDLQGGTSFIYTNLPQGLSS